MQSSDAPDFSFIEETCITLIENKQTGTISQAWSNEAGSSKQCNCVCHKNFIFESNILFILGGLCCLLILLTFIRISIRTIKNLKTNE